jgi:glycerol-3-phosphate cytidylyltransferase|tara:strand:- start:118 stop:627 length:510 start_codon:yes stop_codon:yes gene_type:complete
MRLDYKDCGRIGITCSTFDLLHAGHVVMLEEAKRHCDYLIAALQVDPTFDRESKNKPIQSIVERQIQLAAIKYVDEIVMYSTESELEDLFLTLPLDVRILGTEYRDKEFTAKQICLDRNIELFYNVRDHSFSSTSLRKRIQQTQIDNITAYSEAVMPELKAQQEESDNE